MGRVSGSPGEGGREGGEGREGERKGGERLMKGLGRLSVDFSRFFIR